MDLPVLRVADALVSLIKRRSGRLAQERLRRAPSARQNGKAEMNASEGGPKQETITVPPEWCQLIPPAQWKVYEVAIEALRGSGLRFLLGGAFGLATYTGRWRNTKDIDFFILPEDRETAIGALTLAGFTDYYEQLAYDRGWIYRASRQGLIVDLIWATPNRRTEVDELWFENGCLVRVHSEMLEVVPAEELIWIKLYVLQKDRCDWPDVINLMYAMSSRLNWKRLIERMGADLPLLDGMLTVFGWLCPDRKGDIPVELLKRVELQSQSAVFSAPDPYRIGLLDSRPWFTALLPADRPTGG
jgi:hypothetical protein